MEYAAAAALGFAGGVVGGMLGVGGGILFVPTLVALWLGQVEAAATSLLAIVPTAIVGGWRQQRYGNVRVKDAALLGVLASAGALGGVVAANALPERALEIGFAGLLLFVAWQLARKGLRES